MAPIEHSAGTISTVRNVSLSTIPLIDSASMADLLREATPHWDWVLEHIETNDGYLRIPARVADWIVRFRLENYPELYQNESWIGAIGLRSLFDLEGAKQFDQDLRELSPEGRGKVVRELFAELDSVVDEIEHAATTKNLASAQEKFDALPVSEQKELIQRLQLMGMAVLAGFHQSLSIVVHGEKLTSLVSKALVGDDKAFAKAVQIDNRILTALPYFRDRFNRAATEGDASLRQLVAMHLGRPPYKGRITHKAAYLAFSLLEQCGLLATMKHGELLDLLDDAGVNVGPTRIEDLKNLSKCLAGYRKFQQSGGGLSTP